MRLLTSLAILSAAGLAAGVSAQSSSQRSQPGPQANPLLGPSALPFHAPVFDKIHDADFEPAFEEGLRQQRAEIRHIADNSAPPTFENTIEALERSGQTLARVQQIFNGLSGANTNDTLKNLQETEAPKLAAAQDEIFLNDKLFARVEAVHNDKARLAELNPEARRLVDYDYQQFVLAGAKLSAADKEKLKKLNEEEATLSAQFSNRLLDAANDAALVVDDPAALAGLSPADLQAAVEDAKARNLHDRWLIPLQNTTQQPAFVSMSVRETRHKLFDLSWTRAERGDANDTRAIITRLAQLRVEQSHLLGFEDYAAWKLQDQMAKTPDAVNRFLGQLVGPATSRARREESDLQKLIDEQHGGFTLEPWDWNFYAEQIRKAKYNLDQSEIKPYFELNRVLTDGVFYAAHQLYGISFKERHDLPVYQKDVRVFEVTDKTGAALGLFYADYFKRDNKSGGAWMDDFAGQSKLLEMKPVVYNVANFSKPAPGQPALLTTDDVVAMFHEFGHALHGLFGNQIYPSISGAQTARDFVEFPSQFNEHWAFEPSVLAHYALHYKTRQPMPQALVEKIIAARDFNAGYNMTELLGAAELDMQWHTITSPDAVQDVDAFERSALEKTHVDLRQVPPRYRSTYFLHIWANGYNAGYYAYLWTQMLADDAFAWFKAHGGLTRANGDHFRDTVLSRGNTRDYSTMFRDLTGHDPQIEPMLKYRGLGGEIR
ncbi:MAG TPA: peptidyl-dipeptidase Dcp [Vicinamibacterales bacterium]|nr:peptidyl-dipeptidase Dcp [Vicinamibacterales bacterium]